MFHILVIDDDKNTRRLMRAVLEGDGYTVTTACDGEEALSVMDREHIDLAVLDIMMPRMDGYECTKTLRSANNELPILMVSAKQLSEDRKKGFLVGTDDYMTKPFSPAELMAHLRALTRRRGDVVIDEIKFADIRLDLNTHDLSCAEKSVHLSGKEFEVLSILMGSSSRVVSKQDLLTRVWGTDGEASENSVEAYVSFIRKKLSHIGSKVQVTTLRMLGYRLEVL